MEKKDKKTRKKINSNTFLVNSNINIEKNPILIW